MQKQKLLIELRDLCGRIQDLTGAAAVLEWDQQVFMPPDGHSARGRQQSTLAALIHDLASSDRMGELLDELSAFRDDFDPDSDDARLIRVLKRDYDRQRRIPAEFVRENARVTAEAYGVWEAARENADFQQFLPDLKAVVALQRQYAEFFRPYRHCYDPLLDLYEPGLTFDELNRVFSVLKVRQKELLEKILRTAPKVELPPGPYEKNAQWEIGLAAATLIGYNWKRGRLDQTEHPFTTTFHLRDVRITTHIYPENPLFSLYSVLHETGHALYELGIAQELDRTPLGTGVSLGIHESQSRLWENLVGRSAEFIHFFHPRLQTEFPQQLKNVSEEHFFHAVNRVEPSLIRTEADEVTYNFHIMLRTDLEVALLTGELAPADLPDAWNEKMRQYLGISPENDREGVLQDVHWACGNFGYFPTYAVGNLVSAQIFAAAERALPTLREELRNGNFGPLREWLTENLYRHGAKFTPAELLKRITGESLNQEPYLQYLERKFLPEHR